MVKPKVSVIMGIYNCEATLELSLNSLLSQTFQDFEIIMCDDGSKDNTYDIAKGFLEKYQNKFILLKNSKNMGLNYTLNKCLENASGDYIARMDGDDISLLNRFEKQVEYLDNNPEIAIVSSAMIYFDESGDWGKSSPKEYPEKRDLIKGTPFAHAPCMVRKEAFEVVKGYTVDNKLLRVEDYHLWIKMYKRGFKGYNFREALYKMRNDQNAVDRRSFKGRLNEAYVKYLAVKELKLSYWKLVYVFRPLIVGLLPRKVYLTMHKKRLGHKGLD